MRETPKDRCYGFKLQEEALAITQLAASLPFYYPASSLISESAEASRAVSLGVETYQRLVFEEAGFRSRTLGSALLIGACI